jgi:ferrochelatase
LSSANQARSRPPYGVLLLQLGTPDDASVPAVRRYLREFLSDRRVIENVPRPLWWLILNLQILRKRPKESAAKYRRIWDPKTGMPLLYYTRKQAEALQKALPDGFRVRYAMRYGNPAIRAVAGEMIAAGVERLIVLPMYPQYSATSTASALDGLFLALMKERRVPALRVVPPYYAHPAYLDAVVSVIKAEQLRLLWEPEFYLLTYHGIPQSYARRGDPYPQHVEKTTELLVDRLGWLPGMWGQTYQSLFGKEPWLQPYTEKTLQELARKGIKRVFVAAPGFTTDCLETLDEIGNELRETFKHAGGEELHRCPCLNDSEAWVKAMATLVLEEAGLR